MIRVLVVDDSPVARAVLVHLIEGAGDMSVVGTAGDGVEAIEAAERLRPDIITMDIMMPRMGGPEAIDHIMHKVPTPIVVVTGNTITEEVRATFRSLESGALAILPRPHGMDTPEHEASAEELLQTLRLMSEVKVVRRLNRRSHPRKVVRIDESQAHAFRMVAFGASTGGPAALKTIVSELRRDFPVPLLIVQHIAPGFVEGFVNWLRDSGNLPVHLARDGEPLLPGTIYVAPEAAHIGFGGNERVRLSSVRATELGMICPSVTHLFNSVADVFGPQAIGVLLTGMGRDGADGLLKMKRAGAITIAQDRQSSMVHGMPGEAIALGAADFILPPARIAELLSTFAAAAFPLPR
jgi:two-component system, chemotaxis family, protein-glutamate methylesterase/glutaminase